MPSGLTPSDRRNGPAVDHVLAAVAQGSAVGYEERDELGDLFGAARATDGDPSRSRSRSAPRPDVSSRRRERRPGWVPTSPRRRGASTRPSSLTGVAVGIRNAVVCKLAIPDLMTTVLTLTI